MKRYPFVKQMSHKDCGAASLAMIIQYYKGLIPLDKLYDMTKTTKQGTTAYHLIQAAKEIGFDAFGIKCNIEEIKNNKLPAIAHVLIDGIYPHFLVIYKIDFSKKQLLIADPATKIKTISFFDFSKIFTQHLIILTPNRKIPKEKVITNQTLKNILYFDKINFIELFILSNVETILTFLNLYFITKLNSNNLISLILFMMIVITVQFFVGILKDKKLISMNLHISKKLMSETYQSILLLPYQYYRNHTTGDLMTRINDLEEIKDFVPIYIIKINQCIFLIGTTIFLFFLCKQLFIIMGIFAILYSIIDFIFHKKVLYQWNLLKEYHGRLNSFITETILGIESIKGINLEKTFYQKYQEKLQLYQEKSKEYQSWNSKLQIIRDYLSNFSLVILFLSGYLFIQQNLLNFQQLIAFYFIYNYFNQSMKTLLELRVLSKNIKNSLCRVLSILLKDKPTDHNEISGTICFHQSDIVNNDVTLLKNASFQIKQTDKIMMIGPSGSGKSTILKMIKQFYEANNIYIHKMAYQQFDFKNKVAYLSQNEYLFTGTLYDNITMNRPIDEQILQKVIDTCELKEIIQKDSLGIYSLIEENGFNLSGGERQRIILARALVSDFEYLLIDEGLSEVDQNAERRIIKKLFQYYADRTIILVSHRLDNIDLFPKVLKVNQTVEVLTKNIGGVLCYKT